MTDHPARLNEAIAAAQAALGRWRREEDDPDAAFPFGGADNDGDDPFGIRPIGGPSRTIRRSTRAMTQTSQEEDRLHTGETACDTDEEQDR